MEKYSQHYTFNRSNNISVVIEFLVVLLIFASAFLWLFL